MPLRGTVRRLAGPVLAAALLLGMACGDDDNDGVGLSSAPPADSGVPATLPSGSDSGAQSEADFTIEVQDRLTQFQNELAELDTEVAAMDQAQRAEVEPMLEELRTTITQLESELLNLQSAPEGPDREAVKSEIEDTLELAQTQIDELQAVVGI